MLSAEQVVQEQQLAVLGQLVVTKVLLLVVVLVVGLAAPLVSVKALLPQAESVAAESRALQVELQVRRVETEVAMSAQSPRSAYSTGKRPASEFG